MATDRAAGFGRSEDSHIARRWRHRFHGSVEPEQEILTAAQPDAMTPDERRDEFERRVVREDAELSDDLRERIRSTAERLARARADR